MIKKYILLYFNKNLNGDLNILIEMTCTRRCKEKSPCFFLGVM